MWPHTKTPEWDVVPINYLKCGRSRTSFFLYKFFSVFNLSTISLHFWHEQCSILKLKGNKIWVKCSKFENQSESPARKNLPEVNSSSLPLKAGLIRVGLFCLAKFWVCPRVKIHQPLWVTCSSFELPYIVKKIILVFT